ncbi:MAG TPA: hypothetical protein VNH82_08730 [Candidatus Dormibacteraeota bacterium]|nr:hypothetical protein [Candidatus Dormibacteraeota bacterium]
MALTYVDQATAQVTSATTISVTMPATAVVGDLAIAAVTDGNLVVTVPPGWTVAASVEGTTACWRLVQSGDPGSVFTFGIGNGLTTGSAAMLIYSGNPTSGSPVASSAAYFLNAASSITAPSVTADTSSDLLICVFAAFTNAAGLTMSVPAGMTDVAQLGSGSTSPYPYPLTVVSLAVSAGATPTETSTLSSGTVVLVGISIAFTVATVPSAPTITAPTSGQYTDVSAGLLVSWGYNGNGAPQTGYLLELDGNYWTGSAWTGTLTWVTSSATNVSLPTGTPVTNGSSHTLTVNTRSVAGQGTAASLTFVGEALPFVIVAFLTSPVTIPNPTITWTDILPATAPTQTAYRAVVYSAAQYGAVGFSPGFGPSYYDSGVLPGAGESQTPSGLPATGTFRSYVQIWDAHQASLWAYSSSYTLSVTVPASPTLTAAWAQATASTTLVATGATSFSSQPTYASFYSSDDSGVTWQLVRNGSDVSLSTGSAILIDYEAPAQKDREYAAYVNALVSGSVLTSAASTVASVTATLGNWWLKNLLIPAQNVTVEVSADFATDRIEQSTVVYPIGQNRPSVIFDVIEGVDGSVTVTTTTAAAYTALETILGAQAILLLQSPYGYSRYIRLALNPAASSIAQESGTLSASSAASPFIVTVIAFVDVGLSAIPITS